MYGLPLYDFEDETNLTIRQRQWFRWLNPTLPFRGKGPYQYPRWAYELMNRLDYAGAFVFQDGTIYTPDSFTPFSPDAPIVLSNVNVTNNNDLESEDYLQIDPGNQTYLVGASNSLTVNGQVVHHSSDGGATWATVMLTPMRSFHSDPGVNFRSNGTVYSCVVDYTHTVTAVEFYKSTDHGSTWTSPPNHIIVDDSSGNDKELGAIDNQATSSCQDEIYVCWDDGNHQYVSSTTTTSSETFRAKTTVQDKAFTIGCDLAVGPPASSGAAGPAYNVWADTKNNAINFSKTTDCGASWSTFSTVATTTESYDYCVPAQNLRRVLIYPSVDVDRSNGPRKGWVYVVWNDLSATRSGCGTASDTTNSNVWFARSSNGGSTWSTPVMVHSNPAMTDQFFPWMRVDDADGTIHISWHDTRDDPANRVQTNLYYTRSTDGGTTFLPEVKVTTAMTDETAAGADSNQYGDYEGIAVRNGVVYPFWTDRRASSGTDEEVFTAKICSEPKDVAGVTASDINACVRSGVQVSWTAPNVFWGDGGFGSRKYQLYMDSSLVTDNISSGASSTTYSPGNGSSHSFSIRAVNGCTNTADYTSASAVDDQDITPPSTSGWNSLHAAKSGGSVALTWSSPAGDATAYNAYRDTVPNSPFGAGQRLNGSPISSPNYSDTPPAGTVFYYDIRALDSCSNES